MERIRINTTNSYEVLIGKGLMENAGEYVKAAFLRDASGMRDMADKSGSQAEAARPLPDKLCIVTDSNVRPLYLGALISTLEAVGFETCIFQFDAGESSKTTDTLTKLVEYMARMALSRNDAVVALGGGVAGDIAGFAASVYMRGIRLVQIPTTLLACLDSSVGGKNGVNLAAGKNYIGTFWQPELVLCDVAALETLPKEAFLDGVAEAVKCGAIADPELFSYLGGLSPKPETVIKKSVEIKAKIVEADERDEGLRAVLNFGHTIGHAIEKCSDYSITHGHAVAMGMVIITRAAFNKGLAAEDFSVPIENVLKHHGLPTQCPFDAMALKEAVLADKKRSGDYIKIILLESIGKARVEKLSTSVLGEFIAAGL